jgi:Rv2632c-like
MPTMKRWTVDLFIDENDGHTYAEARLHSSADKPIIGVGRAALNPADRDVPEIGDELAAARALNDLGHRLLVAAAADISALTAEDVHLSR